MVRSGPAAPAVKVAVLDPLACYRRGLLAALVTAGFEAFEPPQGWCGFDEVGAVVMALLDEVDAQRLRGLRKDAPGTPGLALLPEVTVTSYGWAIRSGATSAVGRDAAPEEIVECLLAACAGRATMPVALALGMAGAVDPVDHPAVDATEVRWLVRLSEGRRVLDLAQEMGYSEREMFRRLHRLYDAMGVCGRTEALLAAQRWGLV
jgi:DNA-binding NarL/FixJ family response regulator